MPLEPRIARIVKLMNTLDRRSDDTPMVERRRFAAESARRFGSVVMRKGPEPPSTVDRTVPVAGGRIRVRTYTPAGTGPFPLYVFIHGGGWCAGTLDERDPRCRTVSAGARCVVASIDYRLAPENGYPTPVEDCYAALTWLVDHAAELDVDPSRVAVGGESAGANLAAVICLMAREQGGPALCHQWLDVPAVDLTLSQPSFRDVPDGYRIGLSLGGPTGYAINPARDLAPRLAHALLPIPGKGDSDWSYAWVPVAGPLIGGALGAVFYNVLFSGLTPV